MNGPLNERRAWRPAGRITSMSCSSWRGAATRSFSHGKACGGSRTAPARRSPCCPARPPRKTFDRSGYVMYARRGEDRLIAAMNGAVEKAIRDGRLKSIYGKYGIWNPAQEGLLSASPTEQIVQESSGWQTVGRCAPIMVKAAGMTVVLS